MLLSRLSEMRLVRALWNLGLVIIHNTNYLSHHLKHLMKKYIRHMMIALVLI